ncbi:MAG: hypothetical protein ACU836_08730 [Gammaproteobacteria bacterium]
MNKVLIINGLLFGALSGMSQVSLAALSGADTVTIDFPGDNMTLASYGIGVNQASDANGACPETSGSPCYYEDGFVIGPPNDNNQTNHVHRIVSFNGGGFSDKALAYHSDSSGIYLRAQDGSAFDLRSMLFHAPITLDNTNGDQPEDRWEIFGFNDSINPDITTTDGYETATAYASVANGFVGTVGTDATSDSVLNQAFKNIAAVWIHYNGYPATPPGGISFSMAVDDIRLAAPTTVPAPAATWLFGTGLLSLFSLGRNKSKGSV